MTTETGNLSRLEEEALAGLAAAGDEASLERWRADWLGRQDGRVTVLLRGIREVPQEERAAYGAAVNALKARLEAALEERRAALKRAELERLAREGALDVTLPGRPQPLGRLHPITRTLRDCLEAFKAMGFRVAEGPEVEWDLSLIHI